MSRSGQLRLAAPAFRLRVALASASSPSSVRREGSAKRSVATPRAASPAPASRGKPASGTGLQ